jgi:hypothetical protein
MRQAVNQVSLTSIKDVTPLIQELDHSKADFLVPRTRIVAGVHGAAGLQFCLDPEVKRIVEQRQGYTLLSAPAFDYTQDFLSHIAMACGVNKDDIFRGAERHPEETAKWINTWFQDETALNDGRKRPTKVEDKCHLVRAYLKPSETGAGILRALRSDSFRLGLDVSDILAVVLKLLRDHEGQWSDVDVKISISDTLCHCTIDNKSIVAAVKPGDFIAASMYWQSSDIGSSAFMAESRILRLACLNGARIATPVRKTHRGSRLDTEDIPDGMLSEGTKKLQAATLLSGIYDAMRYCFDSTNLAKIAERIRNNQSIVVEAETAKAVFQVIQSAVSVSETAKDELFGYFSREERNRDGLVQATSAYGRDLGRKDYNKAAPIEIASGRLLGMESEEWWQFVSLAKAGDKVAVKKAAAMLN